YIQLARDMFEGLLTEAPDDPKRQGDLANCLQNVAIVLYQMNREAEADAAVNRAIALRQEVLDRSGNTESGMLLAYSLHYAGSRLAKREPGKALELLTREFRLRERLTGEQPQTPEQKYALGLCADLQALTLAFYLKRIPEAKERYEFAVGLLREAAHAQPDK